MGTRRVGVLVMSYGTPRSIEGIKTYYTHIRRGIPPSEQQLQELTMRYEAIVGGVFPLREFTDRQVQGLQRTLDRITEGLDVQYLCYQGLKHAEPFIETGILALAQDGIREAISVVLAPHFSGMSVGSYNKRALEAAAQHQIVLKCANSYHLHPQLLDAWAERVQEQLRLYESEGVPRTDVKILFSAHSLPSSILERNDPYPNELNATASAIAERCKWKKEQWSFTWQSAGRTATPWLGPDILDTLDKLHAAGVKHVVCAPIGFVSDHLEVLYDLDIEAAQTAAHRGMKWKRTRMLNDDPQYMSVLANVVLTLDQC